MRSGTDEIQLTRAELRGRSVLLVLGPLGASISTAIYNTTSHWWPLVLYGAIYVPAAMIFTLHVARTHGKPLRWFFRSKMRCREETPARS
jgi:hypothetical protein